MAIDESKIEKLKFLKKRMNKLGLSKKEREDYKHEYIRLCMRLGGRLNTDENFIRQRNKIFQEIIDNITVED